MKKALIFLFLSLFLIKCTTTEEEDSVSRIDFTFQKLTTEPISSIVTGYQIIPLETNEESLIVQPSKIMFQEGKFYILQTRFPAFSELFIFDQEGKFINKLDAQGRGPKEYNGISSFDINHQNENITIVDPGLKKIIEYESNGEYISSRQVGFWVKDLSFISCADGSTKIIMDTKSSLSSEEGGNYDIYLLDKDYKVEKTFFPFNDPISIGMGNGNIFFKLQDHTSYFRAQTDSVFKVSCDGISLKYKLNYPAKVLPRKLTMQFTQGKISPSEYSYGNTFLESSSHLASYYMFDKEHYYGIYEKYNDKSIVFQVPKDPSCGNCGFILRGVCNDKFVMYADVTNIKGILDLIDPERVKYLNVEELNNIINSLDYESNPVLLLLDFKL